MPDDPQDQDDNSLLAVAANHLASGKLAEAEAVYCHLISKHPNVAELRINLGAVYRALGKDSAALKALQSALKLSPDLPAGHFNLANLQRHQGQVEKAEFSYRACLDQAPDFYDASLNLADFLGEMGRFQEAKTVLENAVAVTPTQAELWNNLGNTCLSLGDLGAARSHLSQALFLNPDDPIFTRNLATVYRAQGDDRTAKRFLNRILKSAPKDPEALCMRAFISLAAGDYAAGWEDYKWRWKTKLQGCRRPFNQARWDGFDLSQKSIVIWGEQGIGDEIMYASILPDLLRSGASVYLECAPRLMPLFKRSFPSIELFERRDPPYRLPANREWHFQAPIADLALHFRTKESDFGDGRAYLQAHVGRRNDFCNHYRRIAEGRSLVGIAWKSRAQGTGSVRSLKLVDLQPLLDPDGFFYVNLQYGNVGDEILDLKKSHGTDIYQDPSVDQLADLDGFAAQISALDLIVTVANTTVHVAGGLGIKTEVLIPGVADWRWMHERTDSPWYGSVTLHRNLPEQRVDTFMKSVAEKINS